MSTRDFIPISLALVSIVVGTIVEGLYMQDRWNSSSVDVDELRNKFAKVPLNIGPWRGEDLPVDELVRKTAGAVVYVSRAYVNETTSQRVTLWLIVGHSRDVTRHTPNICYPSSGFTQRSEQLRYVLDLPDGDQATFYTAEFERQDPLTRHRERVFWAWNEDKFKKWEAPDSQRFHYGLSRALYKVYFTSVVTSRDEVMEDSPAVEFAEVMLPEIDKALFPKEGDAPTAPAEDAEPAAPVEEEG